MYNSFRSVEIIGREQSGLKSIPEIVCRIKNSLDTHCLQRMQERDISRADVKNGIATGEIIEEYPDDFPNPSCLIFGYNVNGRILHIVAGCDNMMPGSKGQKAVHACMIRLLNLGPAKHEKAAIYAVNQRISNVYRIA